MNLYCIICLMFTQNKNINMEKWIFILVVMTGFEKFETINEKEFSGLKLKLK